MNVLLYLRRLDLYSGAGQLVRMQATGLLKAGAKVRIRCQRGAVQFFIGTGLPVRPVSKAGARALNKARDHIIVDNGMQLSRANVSFVHSLVTEASVYLQRDDLDREIEREAAYFGDLSVDTTIVANSNLVKKALVEHFGLNAQRIVVHYPGFQSKKFASKRVAELRQRARETLQIGADTPVVESNRRCAAGGSFPGGRFATSARLGRDSSVDRERSACLSPQEPPSGTVDGGARHLSLCRTIRSVRDGDFRGTGFGNPGRNIAPCRRSGMPA